MNYPIKGIVCTLLVTYSVIYAHVDTIHVPTATEIAEEERRAREQRIKDARDTYEDETQSPEKRYDAFETLVDEEEIL